MKHTREDTPGNIILFMQLFIVLALALGIRIYLWMMYPHVIFLHEADGIGYIAIARNIVENFSINNSIHFPPFYPALIALSSLVTGDYESGARWVSILLGSGMVVPLYLACRYFMSARAAFCAALVAACFYPFVDYSLQPISQATYTMLTALGVWLGLRCMRTSSRVSLAAFGMTSAAIYLTRPEGILFFAFNCTLLMYVLMKDQEGVKLRLSRLSALVVGFMVPFLWYVICIKRVTGSWSISGKSGLTSMGVDASMKLLPSGLTYGESMAGKAGIANLFPSMLGFLKIYVTQLGKFAMVAYSSLPGIVFIVAAVGLALLVYELCRREPAARLKSVCQFAMFLSPLIMLVPVMAFDKIALATSYILPFFIVLLGCSAKGIVWMEGLLARQVERLISTPTVMKQGLSVAVIAAVILSWHSLAPLYKGLSSEDFKDFSGQQDFLLRQTGHWFLNYTDKTAKIMARWSNIGYYGERRWHGLADGSIDDLIVYARRSGVTHIVIDSDAVPRRRPQLKDLLEPSIPHPGLVPVYAEDRFGTRVVIYLVQ